jgi:hypothetical protein
MPTMSAHFVLCIENEGYPASLELRKVYQILGDPAAEERGLVRVIDETGEDYLYPRSFFVPIQVPREAETLHPISLI